MGKGITCGERKEEVEKRDRDETRRNAVHARCSTNGTERAAEFNSSESIGRRMIRDGKGQGESSRETRHSAKLERNSTPRDRLTAFSGIM